MRLSIRLNLQLKNKTYPWENGFLGSKSGEILCYTLVWVFGIQFALKAGQEHRHLRFKNWQFILEHDESGCEFLQYIQYMEGIR